ncbi:MAG: asparagine synthase (glutamine-hydrolyzing) [Pyrinomonadaceae bacterium]|nr:asparagine synthase (glutamine-hydrolyzing) [Pyrinomonadaceae bacterium]
MCGICGVVSAPGTYPIDEAVLIVMRDLQAHRGPDDSGHCRRPGMSFGSRRLSILDLSERGHMPMITEDGRYAITYNGEVYNFRELRRDLETRGHCFRSDSDTEVVLKLYVEHGPDMLQRLNGMFAIAIWDDREQTLFLARDRMGVKPLYYAEQDGALYFASEAKSLFAAGVRKQFDPETWEELLYFRYVAGERTPYTGVKRVLPGRYLLWKENLTQTRRWWNLGERAREIEPPQDAVNWFRETFDDAVNARRIADVPVGVLLSGGLDSGSVAASLALKTGAGVSSYTVRFREPRYDEGSLAQEVADRWRMDHHELFVSPGDLLDRLQNASRLNDEPLVHGNDLHLWAISEYAKSSVTVLLSGEGGDETLGGYVRYRPLRYPALLDAARPVLPRLLPRLGVNGRLGKLGRFLNLGSTDLFVLFNSCEVLPDDLAALGMDTTLSLPYRQQVFSEARETYPGDPVRQVMYYDQHTFLCSILDRNDRMTMGASIECRVPFLDYRLVEGLASLPTSTLFAGRQSKHLLRQAVGDRLPDNVLNHQKWGFAVPWNLYLRQVPELRSLVHDLPDLDPIRHGPFERSLLRKAIESFLAGNNRNGELVRQLALIAIWYQACFQGSSERASQSVATLGRVA